VVSGVGGRVVREFARSEDEVSESDVGGHFLQRIDVVHALPEDSSIGRQISRSAEVAEERQGVVSVRQLVTILTIGSLEL